MLTLIRGLPGSGKSTHARQQYAGVLILEADMLLMSSGVYVWSPLEARTARNMLADLAMRVLRVGADVVVTGCFVTRRSIQKYVDIAERFNQPYNVVSVEGPFRSSHNVPTDVYASMVERWEDWPGQMIVRRNDGERCGEGRS